MWWMSWLGRSRAIDDSRGFPWGRSQFRIIQALCLPGISQPRQLRSHVSELRAHIVSGDADIDDAHLIAAQRTADSAVEFAFRRRPRRVTAADEVADLAVIPLGDDVELAVADLAHGAL